MKRLASVFVFCVATILILTAYGHATCTCQSMSGSACNIWSSSGTGFYWVTGSNPSSEITLTTGQCNQSGESAKAFIYAYTNASSSLCDYTACGGDMTVAARYAKIKVVGDQTAFQTIFPEGLSFTGCYSHGSPLHYLGLTITQTNTECDLRLSTSQIVRMVLNAQAAKCPASYSGSKFTIQIRFYEARDYQETSFTLLDSVTGSIVVKNNPRTSFDPLNFVPDVKEGTAIGWIEKQTYDLSEDTTDSRWKIDYRENWNCAMTTEGVNLVNTSPPYTLIRSSEDVIRAKLPGYKYDMYGLPAYATQDGWSYKIDSSDCYIQYKDENRKIIFHCDSPADNGADNKRYLIRRVEVCTDSQEPDEGDDQWYINYTYNSPARIANIHNGSDPNDPNSLTSATIYYEYD